MENREKRMNEMLDPDLVVFGPYIYVIPTFILYLRLLYILLISEHRTNFNSAFYRIFILKAVSSIICVVTFELCFRLPDAPGAAIFMRYLPPTGVFPKILLILCYHSGTVMFLMEGVVSLNRATTILLSTRHNSFWASLMPFVYLISAVFPLSFTWSLWFTDISLLPDDYTHIPGEAPSTVDEDPQGSQNAQMIYILVALTAFDFRLATFVVGLFNLFFGIGFVYEKNLASATITTICFIVQAICQYFMARAAEIHTKRNVAKRNAHALKVANSFEAMTVEEFSSKLPVIGAEFNNLLAFHHQRLMTFVPTQALRYAAATALPQVTQAVAYTLGCFLVSEGLVRPVVLYKVVQTLYMSAFSFASVVSYSLDVHNSRVGCHQLDDVVNVKEASGKANGIRVWAA
uniref:Serpentine receptor class gamma n=1 Tax=Panagrellus redivivus TaxID=6233 RepID=A0A7E4VWN4_PANRE